MEKTFSYLSTIIAYRVTGKGQPVVLLHGFGEDGTIWDLQIDFLKDHCMLVVPDLPGSGKSGLLGQKSTVKSQNKGEIDFVSIADYSDCIHALLVHEKIMSCMMLGHSMGGYITLAFAEKYPEQLTGFGLIHSTAFADADEKKINRQKAIDIIEAYGAHSFLKTTTPNLFSARFKQQYPEKISRLIDDGKSFTKEALQQYYRAMMLRPDRTNLLKGNQTPVIFVIGTEDIAAPLEDLMKQVSLPNISYIHVLPETGHMGMWEAPEELNQQLLAFINHS